jgi:hypothetical protein
MTASRQTNNGAHSGADTDGQAVVSSNYGASREAGHLPRRIAESVQVVSLLGGRGAGGQIYQL